MSLPPDLIDLLAEFDAAGVDYLLIGGHAVALHGRPRFTKDTDLWLRDDAANLVAARQALERFGAPPAVIEGLPPAHREDVLWMGHPPNRIDLVVWVPGGDFDRAYADRMIIDVDGIAVSVIGREELISIKEASGRPQDVEDAKLLRLAFDEGTARRG